MKFDLLKNPYMSLQKRAIINTYLQRSDNEVKNQKISTFYNSNNFKN